MIEIIETGEATTPFMKFEDRIELDVQDSKGQSVFGVIDQIVKPY